ncbi:glycosyltransferase [Luteimonas huabeiensis]|uniref:glycosyltransferase n=1 Tax=Luteimonas huabeiensis TaxID=1244513 RepID=UPI0004675423|nr:glycosyltransferase [Luteimonas huabeiensis]
MTQADRLACLHLSRTGGPPFNGSVGYVNDGIAPLMRARGWSVRPFALPRPRQRLAQESLVPLGMARAFVDPGDGATPLLAIHDDAGMAIRTPSRAWARHHLVLYHGLAYSPGAWLGNEAIDVHCANSPYLARTLRSLFATPDWRRRRLLDPRALARVVDVPMPVPCVSNPSGNPGFSMGASLPAEVHRALDAGVLLGHAMQPGKQDLLATVGVMYGLNDLARRANGRRAMLAISEQSLPPQRRAAVDGLLAGTGMTCADLFLPLPHLHQKAVFELFRAARFGLAYNHFPEPFGFYVLESVHAGCPVYTNGVGNNRFLLPPGHGIAVLETERMVPDAGGQVSPAAFLPVANAIMEGVRDPEAIAAACGRGRRYIDARWSPAEFERGFIGAVERALEPPPPPVDFDSLQVRLGPLVRGFDAASGVVRCDYANRVLSREAIGLVQSLVGQVAAALDGAEMHRIESEHRLFEEGILALQSAGEGGEA